MLDLTAEVLALFDKEGERKTYLILQEILTDMRLIERASMGREFHNAVQTSLYTAAIASGHLMTKGNRIQGDFLVDIFLTEEGAEPILTPQDKQYSKMAVELARKSIAENDGEPHPYVGAVVVKDGKVLATGYRGETGEGRHAEFCALKKINDDVDNVDLSGCTVYTTLEPCSIRKPSKTPCTNRLINGKVERVVYGLADKGQFVPFTRGTVDDRMFR